MGNANSPASSGQQAPPGVEILHTLQGQGGIIHYIAWSPDGRLLASGSSDNTIRLWDVQSGELWWMVMHGTVISVVIWAPDSRMLASGLWDHTIRVWNIQQGKLCGLFSHDSIVSSMAWSSDSQMFATGSGDTIIRVWDVQTGKLQRTLEGHHDGIMSLAWSPDGKILASGSDDQTIRLWDRDTGKLYGTLKGYHGEVLSMSWSPDGHILCSGTIDETIHLWDVQSGDLRHTLEGYYGNTETIAWSPDGHFLAAGAWDQRIHILAPQTGQAISQLAGHANRVLGIRFSPDGRLLASKAEDNTVRLWRCDTWQPVAILRQTSSPMFGGVTFHPSQPLLATLGEEDSAITIWQLHEVDLYTRTAIPENVIASENEEILADSEAVPPVSRRDETEPAASDQITSQKTPFGFTLLHTFSDHEGVINDLAWSPDGALLASASADHTVHLRDRQTGEVLRMLQGHTDTVYSLAWSPDSQRIASGAADRNVCFWESATGRLLRKCPGHYGDILSVAWTPNGRILASGSRDKTIRLWDAERGELLRTIEQHEGAVYGVAWSPDGMILASASSDHTICLWDGLSGELMRTLNAYSGAATSIAWSPDSTVLAAGYADNSVHLWEVSTGKPRMILEGHTDSLLCVRFSPDGQLLATKAYDSTVRFWRCCDGALVAILIEPAAVIAFSGLAFHPTAPILTTRGKGDKSIRIWHLDLKALLPDAVPQETQVESLIVTGVDITTSSTYIQITEEPDGAEIPDVAREIPQTTMPKEKFPAGLELLQTLRGSGEVMTELAWSPDGQLIASGSAEHKIFLWDAHEGQLQWTLAGHADWVSSVAWSPDGRVLASGSFDRSVCLWDVYSGKLIRTLRRHSNDISSVAWSPDGRYLLSASRDQTICLWDAEYGEFIWSFEGHRGPVYDVEWLPDGETIVSASFDKTIRVWDVRQGDVKLILEGHESPVISLSLSPDGTRLASGSHDHIIRLWDAATGRVLSILEGHTNTVLCVRFSPDGRLLASKSLDDTVRLWRCDNGKPVAVLPETGDMLNFSGLAFRPGTSLLASRGERDRIIRLWQLDVAALLEGEVIPETTQVAVAAETPAQPIPEAEEIAPVSQEPVPKGLTLLHTLRHHADLVTEMAWSPDKRHLASGSYDMTVGIWDYANNAFQMHLQGHTATVTSVSWSPDGDLLASGSLDGTIRIWDAQSGELRQTLDNRAEVLNVAWEPDGWMLASGSEDMMIRLWDSRTGELLWTLEGHNGAITDVDWSPDGKTLASASFDNTIRLWDIERGVLLRTFERHGGAMTCIDWAPDGKTLASGCIDNTIALWNPETGRLASILESHTDIVLGVQFSPDGRLLATKSDDGTVRLWQGSSWETVTIATLNETTATMNYTGLAFHPESPILATRGEGDRVIRLWRLDYPLLLENAPQSDVRYYRNAKVVLVGDSGCGKSGLSLVLTGKNWEATESTHGRHVWPFDSREVELPTGQHETRETLLWDLAGQSDYRLIHQLYLNEVMIALVVFDPSSEIEAFTGVQHWSRALDQAQQIRSTAALPVKKFLVAARCDRGSLQVSRERIQNIMKKFGFEQFFETSAREGWHIAELIQAIQEGIDWDALPKVSSSELFQIIKHFLVEQKQAGHVLLTNNDLYLTFCREHLEFSHDKDLRPKFDTCISRVENRGLIRRLSFGGYVLLQPELLDAYASALINAARSQPDGLGVLSEEDVLKGNFKMSQDERVPDHDQERLLLIATVEELLRPELILKEAVEGGTDLVFPSQITREPPIDMELPKHTITFTFEGPLLNIYAILTVRLSQSLLFQKQERWKNVATYTSTAGGTYGMSLKALEEGLGELTLFFDDQTDETTRLQFEGYVLAHLKRLALPDTVQRQQNIVCGECSEPIPASMRKRLRELGRTSMTCPICGHTIPLVAGEERTAAAQPHAFVTMDHAADVQRQRDLAAMVLKGKIATGDFDVFLCHTPQDAAAVTEIGERLKEYGILPWFEDWERQPEARRNAEQRLHRQLEELQKTWDLLSQKIARVERDNILETSPDVKFRLEHVVEELTVERTQVEQRITDLENRLAPTASQNADYPEQKLCSACPQIEQIKTVALFIGSGQGPWQDLEVGAFLRQCAKQGTPIIAVLLPKIAASPEMPVFLEDVSWVDFRQTEPDPLSQLIRGITGERRIL